MRAHLVAVPYENISKLLRFESHGPTLPGAEEYVEAIRERGFGGTCFTANIYFQELLVHLGFNAVLWGMRNKGEHLCIRIGIGNGAYIVDLGLMANYAGPFPIQTNVAIKERMGDQFCSYSSDGVTYDLQIERAGQIIRSYHGDPQPREKSFFDEAVFSTFSPTALFMKTFCVFRERLDGVCAGIWNRNFYLIRAGDMEKRILNSREDLRNALSDGLGMDDYPVAEALQILERRNNESLF